MQPAEMYLAKNNIPMFASANYLENVAVIGKQRIWNWREVHAASLDLAELIGDNQIVCNLCTSHIAFLITWIAALRRGLSQILPPSRGSADLISSLNVCKQPTVVIVDDVRIHVDSLPHCKKILFTPALSRRSYSNSQYDWSLDLDIPIVTLYTSGSTGTPEPKTKSLGQLIEGARVLRSRLNENQSLTKEVSESNGKGLFDRLSSIVSSVPLQHMFGIEASLMPSLVYGIPVIDQRPLLPADIQNVFMQCPINSAWIATPLHLRGITRSESQIKNCSLILTSTMPLSTELANQTEKIVDAPVIEIYGSTETGALATRRTATEMEWTLLGDVEIKNDSHNIAVVGKHFNSPQVMNDRIEQTCLRTFRLHGRNTDLIKIGGRRNSISSLNLILQNLDGLDDGAFYLPQSINSDERLVLVYVSSILSQAEIKAYLAEKIDPVFVPRIFIKVSEIPRTDSGKLTSQSLACIHEKWLNQQVL